MGAVAGLLKARTGTNEPRARRPHGIDSRKERITLLPNDHLSKGHEGQNKTAIDHALGGPVRYIMYVQVIEASPGYSALAFPQARLTHQRFRDRRVCPIPPGREAVRALVPQNYDAGPWGGTGRAACWGVPMTPACSS